MTLQNYEQQERYISATVAASILFAKQGTFSDEIDALFAKADNAFAPVLNDNPDYGEEHLLFLSDKKRRKEVFYEIVQSFSATIAKLL